MNEQNEDIEEYIVKIRNSFYEQNTNQICEDDLWSLIENLTKELEISKQHEKALEKGLKLCLLDENSHLNTKYMKLKDKCKQLEEANAEVQTQLENTQIQMTMELETERLENAKKVTDMEEGYKHEINELKKRFEDEKNSHEIKEQQLFNELQLAQASTALQCDEIEANLTRQIVDVNSKLRQSQSLVRSLQAEISSLKNQLNIQQIPAQLSLQHTPSVQRLPKTETRKYPPLPLTIPCTSGEETEEVDTPQVPPPRGGAHFVFKGLGTPRKKNAVPPLKQCSMVDSVNKNKSVSKKRKLYNPNDLDYLQGLQEDT